MQDGRFELESRVTGTLLLVRRSERRCENSRDVVWTRETEMEKQEEEERRRNEEEGERYGD